MANPMQYFIILSFRRPNGGVQPEPGFPAIGCDAVFDLLTYDMPVFSLMYALSFCVSPA